MIGAIQNSMRLQAQRAAGHKITSRYGIVTSYDPNKYAAKVLIQPEGFASGFLPVATIWAGNGWGCFSPPSAGDQVVVVFIDGDLTAGYIACASFNSTRIPMAAQSGELWLVHAKGGFFKLTNDGKVSFSDGHGATLAMDGGGNINSAATQWIHTGAVEFKNAVHFDDNVQVDKTLTATTDVIGGGKSLKTHTHSGVTSGGGTSGPPV